MYVTHGDYGALLRREEEERRAFFLDIDKRSDVLKENIGIKFNGLKLEEMIEFARKVRLWRPSTIKFYNNYSGLWETTKGFEGESRKTVFQIVRKRERLQTRDRSGTYSIDVTHYFVQANYNGRKIGAAAIMDPQDYHHSELYDFFNIYDSLEDRKESQEKRKKRKQAQIYKKTVEDANKFIKNLRRK